MKRDLDTILKNTQPNGDCLEWTRCLNTDGYPRAVVEGNYNAKIHRIVWELYNGTTTEGKVVRHICDNPKCINPAHLEIGTPRDNNLDRDLRGRHGRASLTINQVVQIKSLLKDGSSIQELAEKFSVSKRVIHRIKVGERYAYV